MSIVYHFTDSLRLPWIIETGELRMAGNRVSGTPEPSFLWATTSPIGDRTCAANASAEAYKNGDTCLVRFALNAEDFFDWGEVSARFPQWTAQWVARAKAAAAGHGERNLSAWRIRATALPLSKVIAVETRLYRVGKWQPFELKTARLLLQDDAHGARGIVIGKRAYIAQRIAGQGGRTGYAGPKSVPLDANETVINSAERF